MHDHRLAAAGFSQVESLNFNGANNSSWHSLGFFRRPPNSNKRELPLTDSSGVLKVTDRGRLVLLNDDRPSMSAVVQMLGSEGALPQPKQPGFFSETNIQESNPLPSKHATFSGYESSISFLEAR
ncbi:hypothetical protein VitviT2T_029700 [Vitis vinifera]|uniref:S-locus receptor kinase C-terminal domain-containing protein n=1 Tax=Vitis vinifera TaxID=29760 RepID=A0ABY9DYW6_VITVI|nr:hypothetical protein VitviT2T_029700 [Vitis vinifera]